MKKKTSDPDNQRRLQDQIELQHFAIVHGQAAIEKLAGMFYGFITHTPPYTDAYLHTHMHSSTYVPLFSLILIELLKCVDSSKFRTRIRKKMASEKKKLTELVQSYNEKYKDVQVDFQDIEKGNFAWQTGEPAEGNCVCAR